MLLEFLITMTFQSLTSNIISNTCSTYVKTVPSIMREDGFPKDCWRRTVNSAPKLVPDSWEPYHILSSMYLAIACTHHPTPVPPIRLLHGSITDLKLHMESLMTGVWRLIAVSATDTVSFGSVPVTPVLVGKP